MTRYEVDFEGIEEQTRKLDQSDETVRRGLMRAMSDSVKTIGRLTRSFAPGSIAGGVDHEVMATPDEGIVGKVEAGPFTARFVEFGTDAHGVGSDVIAREMNVDHDEAFMIARSISRKGTRGQHFMYRAFLKSQRSVKMFFDRALKRIARELGVR